WVMPCGEEAVHARADGTFTIALEPGRQRLVVRVASPRGRAAARLTLADQEVDIPAAGPVALEVPLTLGRGVLHGFVAMGHRDEAVYGIETVVAYRGESLTPVAVALTQPDGAWRMTGLPAGDFRLAVPGSWLGSVFVRATLGDGQTLEVAQPAPGTHTLRGRVGGKLPAKLVVTARSDAALRSTDVDRDGRFAFEGLPAGSYQLTLWSGEVRRVLRLPEPHAVPGPEVRLDW
ncbi:MAG: carboxypeptidase regulatory-like domain-containing protein, partial [Armatimonadetes bacterium]|nr:carboxypeptidase regulatory-like domain-containing protein [Armatimonadota bacterium]